MIAAIYARKSTEQYGVADEQKSVARQVEHAREFAVRKGWTVDEGSVFVDDGISGAEFANRSNQPADPDADDAPSYVGDGWSASFCRAYGNPSAGCGWQSG